MLPLDLHVLGLPPAFNLSHDQTLQFKSSRIQGSIFRLSNRKQTHEFTSVACVADNLSITSLTHKHPHELLDSVVKEQLVKSFVSTEARILQHPHFPSSDFENFFSNSTACAFDSLSASRQREAHSTAFKTAVNRLFSTASDHSDRTTNRTKPPPRQLGAFYTAFAALQPPFLI